MPAADPLCRLVATLQPSLLMYLADSGIWSYPGDEPIKLAIADAVDGTKGILDRAGALLQEREVALPKAAFPLSFTALHDLDLRALLPRLIAGLKQQLAGIDAIAAVASGDAAAADIAADARRSTQQHVDALEQLVVKLKAGLTGAAVGA
jgi:hypothetical protein